MQMDGRDRKTNPADNWRSLPCFCAWMAIFTLLSNACWLFYQTKRVPYAMKRLAEVHMVLWNGLSFLLSHFSSFYILPVCLSVSFSLFLCVSVTDWVKYHLSGECCLDWHEIRTDQLDSYMLFLLLLSGMRLWCTSIAWTRGNNNTEAYSAD